MMKEGILIFFYVDDIVLAYRKAQEKEEAAMAKLRTKYPITGGDDLEWFLGIRIIRDRKEKLLWLSQASFCNLATIQRIYETPMEKKELLPYEKIAIRAAIHSYQRKVGSLMYAAVCIRPDIAFAVSRLSRFLTNSRPEHHEAADRALRYLKGTRNRALQLGGGDTFGVESDASFADNSVDRESSQAYIMVLFGGTIGWQANNQATVTTSTTEAELLALSQAVKEGTFVMRLLKEIHVRFDNEKLTVECDNTQTIQLVNEEGFKLQTNLRHVDIHNHWLRQEVREGRLEVIYTPTKEMIANGLTKALGKVEFDEFFNQINLPDITHRLGETEKKLQIDDFTKLLGED